MIGSKKTYEAIIQVRRIEKRNTTRFYCLACPLPSSGVCAVDDCPQYLSGVLPRTYDEVGVLEECFKEALHTCHILTQHKIESDSIGDYWLVIYDKSE